MLKPSDAANRALTARRRQMTARATFDLRDPDAVVAGAQTNTNGKYSQIAQVYDAITEQNDLKIGTLEKDRMQLDGSWALPPNNPADLAEEQMGWWCGTVSGADCGFAEPYPYLEITFTGLSVLQVFTLWFSQNAYDGYGVAFRLDVYSADTLAYTRTVTENTEYKVVLDKFAVYDPTRVRVTVMQWSRPYCYPRITDMFLGLFERWTGREIASLDVLTESTFTGLKLPYSTCDLRVYNRNHRFDPYAPDSIFQSIEERQAIPIDWGVYLPSGKIEWIPGGWYYQQSGGWEIKGLTVKWSLVDIIGMLVKRNYSPPEVLPTTLSGWVASIVACLGVNLAERYVVDDDVKDLELTAEAEDVQDKTCGEVLRFACQATATWAHQDFATGFLHVSKRGYEAGANITGSNMPSWPVMEANDEIADITFKLDEGEVTFPGTNTESDTSLTINNPFVHTTDDARRVVSNVLSQYGGRKFTIRSRGNPASETGDIDTVATAFGTSISARRYKHQLKLENGVMRNLPAYLIQTATDKRYDHKIILIGAGKWQAPAGVTSLFIQLVGGGEGGGGGQAGYYVSASSDEENEPIFGEPGKGGLVYIRQIQINDSQVFEYNCGKGGVGGRGSKMSNDVYSQPLVPSSGASGTETTFGAYSSANGVQYEIGITDVDTGDFYGSSGEPGKQQQYPPINGKNAKINTGNGGNGGSSGQNGYWHVNRGGGMYRVEIDKYSTDGADGGNGADGVIIVQYNDP
nr:hypothetical protein [uncultured Butyricicoccus sp.]